MQKNQNQYVSRRRQSTSRTATMTYGRNRNMAVFQPTASLGPIAHTVLVALMILVLGLIYLTQSTKPTSYGYEIRQIDAEIAELQTKKSDLEVENARLTALETIESSSVAQQMVSPASVNYID